MCNQTIAWDLAAAANIVHVPGTRLWVFCRLGEGREVGTVFAHIMFWITTIDTMSSAFIALLLRNKLSKRLGLFVSSWSVEENSATYKDFRKPEEEKVRSLVFLPPGLPDVVKKTFGRFLMRGQKNRSLLLTTPVFCFLTNLGISFEDHRI